MLNIVNHNLFFFIILIAIASVSAIRKRQAKSDSLCGQTRSVLCVNATFTSIGTTARSIEQLADEIKQNILDKNPISGRLTRVVEKEMDSIRSHLPPSGYHSRYHGLNNIDQEYLGHLLQEGHEAMSYYYNSLTDMLKTSDDAGLDVDLRLEQIKHSLGMIICPYRNALAVYSLDWQLIDQIDRIHLSREVYEHASTVIRDAHSLIIVRLLETWMERLRFVIDNLYSKFY